MFSFKVMPYLLVSAQAVSQGPFHGIFTAMFFGGVCGVFFCVLLCVVFCISVADFAAPQAQG